MLFGKEELTLGQASKCAAIHQHRFRHLLASCGIGPHYDVAKLEEDVETLKRLGQL
jgi:predicted HTH domain antitoxin